MLAVQDVSIPVPASIEFLTQYTSTNKFNSNNITIQL